ncbi:MAG: PilZ domain-containing protein [Planctomycetota bacterium]
MFGIGKKRDATEAATWDPTASAAERRAFHRRAYDAAVTTFFVDPESQSVGDTPIDVRTTDFSEGGVAFKLETQRAKQLDWQAGQAVLLLLNTPKRTKPARLLAVTRMRDDFSGMTYIGLEFVETPDWLENADLPDLSAAA